jgi:hypothetical protein
MAIRSSRNVFIGCHVTKPVKAMLEAAAKQNGQSLSKFAYNTFVEKLDDLGFDVDMEDKRDEDHVAPRGA